MKAFFERYSYESVRLALNQIAISMFGFALAMTAGKAESDALLLWSSIGSIVFYLALTYGTAHKTGSGDRLSIQYGKIPFRPYLGLVLSLIANSVNLLLAILITVGQLAEIGELESISRLIALLIQGMYQGVLATVSVGGVTLNGIWWSYFVITLPAMLVATLGYIAGAKDFHITKMGIPDLPESDRPSKQELREQRELEKKSRK
ncbi:MAG: hypothetical protein IJ363_08855 [Clostridia bacterium]|nr:hypothetical protein [Clostridia bacterium]MBQ7910878.1 hypothetical protein [Clostridia bacterium]